MGQVFSFLGILSSGFFVTVGVAVGAALLAFPVSLLGGIARQSSLRPVRWTATGFVAVFRGTSAVVQLFWAYYALPLLGIRLSAMSAGIIVLGLNTAAYGAEIVRGALNAVPRGQWEAGTALNMSRRQALLSVVLPQALLIMLPSFGNLLVELLKNSALVSLITLSDLTFQGQSVLRGQFPAQTTLIFCMLLAIYYGLSKAIGVGVSALEARLSRGRVVEKAS